MNEATLVGGPQDGARVTIGGGVLPPLLYVGCRWLGDGYSAWSRTPSYSFPAAYSRCGDRYVFLRWFKGEAS